METPKTWTPDREIMALNYLRLIKICFLTNSVPYSVADGNMDWTGLGWKYGTYCVFDLRLSRTSVIYLTFPTNH